MPLRCLIVDDNASFLQAASTLLRRQGLTVAGLASNAADGLRLARQLHPDVVLVDIVLGGDSGFDLARQLAAANGSGPTVILVSTHAQTDFAELIDEAPAVGFISKSELSAEEIRRLVG